MNHNPIPTENIPTFMLKVVDLTTVLKAIGHPNLLDDGVDAFSDVTFGDAAYTLVPAERVGTMVELHLSANVDGLFEDDGAFFTDEQADRLDDFFAELAEASVYINMEG